MLTLERELRQLLVAIQKARAAGDGALLAALNARKEKLCNLLGAFDPVHQ
jgi:hypothetical protein